MKWYYSKDGVQVGPVDVDELKAKIASGEIGTADLVWREGMSDWLPAAQVPELGSTGTYSKSYDRDGGEQGDSPAQPAQPAIQSPPMAQGPVPGAGKATASMVLGIVAAVFGLCGCYGMLIAVPCGILAIVFGTGVKNQAKLNPALEPELGKAKAGIITGWIGLALSVLLTIAVFVLGFGSAIIEEM